MDDFLEEKLFGVLDSILERADAQNAAFAEEQDRLQLGQLVAYCEVLRDFLDAFDFEEAVRARIGDAPEERYLQ